LRKAQDVINLPVIDVSTGKQRGTVKDLVLDSNLQVLGMIVDRRNWFSAARFLPWEDILAIGTDAVTIAGVQVLRSLEEWKNTGTLLSGERRMKGLPVITRDGRQLGMVEDVYFGQELGTKIVGYELTQGLIDDLQEGRKWLPAGEAILFGDDAVIVPAEYAEQLKETKPSHYE